jgi:hypothetical protein
MTEPNRDWLAVVQKLLAQAEDKSVTPEEAEAFSSKAEQLMMKHAITDGMLAAARQTTTVEEIVMREMELAQPYPLIKRDLIWGLARAFGCRAVSFDGWRYDEDDKKKRVHRMQIFGFDSDLRKLELLFASLCIQMSYAVAGAKVPYYENGKTFKHSFCVGYVDAVESRLLRMRDAAMTESRRDERTTGGPSTDLVFQGRKARVDSAVEKRYPKLRRITTTTGKSDTGYGRGHEEGQKASLHQPQVSQGRRNSITY